MEMDEVKGDYALDNGATLKTSSEQRRLYAQLGQRCLTELVAVGENRFVCADQWVTMQFRPIPFGDQIVLTYPADLKVAASEPTTVRSAANR